MDVDAIGERRELADRAVLAPKGMGVTAVRGSEAKSRLLFAASGLQAR
jgi:hypothetical protein